MLTSRSQVCRQIRTLKTSSPASVSACSGAPAYDRLKGLQLSGELVYVTRHLRLRRFDFLDHLFYLDRQEPWRDRARDRCEESMPTTIRMHAITLPSDPVG